MRIHCDYECAEANNCQVGGIECENCGGHFCSNEITRWHGKVVCENCEIELEEEFKGESEVDNEL